MIVELRNLGNMITIYTDNNQVAARLRKWKQYLYQVPYYQGNNLIGVDLMFESKAKADLIRALKNGNLKLDLKLN